MVCLGGTLVVHAACVAARKMVPLHFTITGYPTHHGWTLCGTTRAGGRGQGSRILGVVIASIIVWWRCVVVYYCVWATFVCPTNYITHPRKCPIWHQLSGVCLGCGQGDSCCSWPSLSHACLVNMFSVSPYTLLRSALTIAYDP